LVCLAFHGRRPSRRHVAVHVNGNRKDDRAANLQWMLPKEKIDNAVARGTHVKGERHAMHKLTEPEVIEIRKRYAAGQSIKTIADVFQVTPGNVSFIVKGRTWKHLLGKTAAPAVAPEAEALKRDMMSQAA
jgi:DNA-directed RNA polymerase specialized sigma24 family protein